MKKLRISPRAIITGSIIIASVAYSAFYFNYFETPTGDYMGNIRVRVLDYMAGNFPGTNYKFLPLYPLILTLLTPLNPVQSADTIYLTAIALNLALFLPYILLARAMFRRFLSEYAALWALLFLGLNIYTVYMATNSELEMLLSLLIILSLYLALKGSRLSYATAFLAALTKWDAVFIIPAVMFRDFFYKKKRLLAITLGTAATAGIAAWLVLSFINSPGHAHPYVSEIAHRGPNIYRYPIDCYLVTTSFVQWMATHAWFAESPTVKISLFAALIVPAALALTGILWGVVLAWRRSRREFAPIFVFLAGFILIHLVYQNTKDRYVMPILWILVLFMFYGLSEGIAPRARKLVASMGRLPRALLLALASAVTAAGYGASIFALSRELTPAHLIFVFVFTGLAAALILYGTGSTPVAHRALFLLFSALIINLMVFYGARTLDHHGLSRVEFKKAALWYRDHAVPGDRMLISETNVPVYYSGFGEDKYLISYRVKGNTIDEIIPELAKMGVTYVFVDDFYIRRLAIKDPNAIDRKAWIFMEIRNKGEKTGRFRLIKTFHTKGGITSYLYRFVP
ncbi:MAG: hypothetical protein JW838_09975 [Spirochaetes bacterium]|nr:hypothetical protein [Spirochaetota bacterium]